MYVLRNTQYLPMISCNFFKKNLNTVIADLYFTFVQTELECLEETLEKRRAELREADKRLRDCRGDLEQARGDAEEMILHYDSVKAQLDERSSELELLGLYLSCSWLR